MSVGADAPRCIAPHAMWRKKKSVMADAMQSTRERTTADYTERLEPVE